MDSTFLSTILGILIGYILSFLTTWLLKTRETSLRIQEKIIEKKLIAYERVFDISNELINIKWNVQADDSENETHPAIMNSVDNYKKWQTLFYKAFDSSIWWEEDMKIEFYFIQKYFNVITKLVINGNNEQLIKLGIIVSKDFEEISIGLEKLTKEYLEKRIFKLKFNPTIKQIGDVGLIIQQKFNQTILHNKEEEIKHIFEKSPENH